MKWFLRFLRSSLRESRQAQTLKDSSVTNSTIHQTQAGRDALSFPNAEQVLVVYNGWFGSRQIATGVDWDWAGRVIKEQRAEVRNRLKYVLRDRAPMTVELSEQPERVNLPALESQKKLTIAGQDSESLDPGKLMIEVFGRDDIDGKLLILGTPGAGKTTVLLSLAEQLLAGAIDNPKTVIPIVFELSTWKKDDQSIRDWLIDQLYDLYGGDRKLKRYEQWLEQQVLLPLLDGLDELGMERQQKCMAKLNEFTRQYRQVVVCCRSKEFEESGIRLGNLRGAVELEPLSDRQILTYLQQVEREGLWQQIQDTPEMRQMLEPIEGEAGLLRVPLFVSIAASIYQVDQPFRTKGELLERYVDRQLSFDVRMSDRRKELEKRRWAYVSVEKEPKPQITRHYLAWLARRLNGINEVSFLIEKIQLRWLEKTEHKRWYQVLVALLVMLVYSLLLASLFGLPAGLIAALFGALSNIQPVESFQISISRTARQEIIRGLIFGLVSGLIFGLVSGLVSDLIYILNGGRSELSSALNNSLMGGLIVLLSTALVSGLFWGLFLGAIGGLIYGLRQDLKIRSQPNQGIHNSFDNFCFSATVSVVLISLFFGLLIVVPSIARGGLLNPIYFRGFRMMSLLAIAFAFIRGGGLAFVQHFCLRFVVSYTGAFPFFCVSFLNYCTERRLLQRIGGRYRFIHRELLEHFAKG
ncbi:NACHT domain-containing protein [Leptolyngbya boryana CZ1]|uniref:NACHT domain-containing protein n=1 Tax=Leptolyngbya boryana CZ1 TaxID=3060204 RepID=A0AA96WRK2_LEPBY|nr:NACHT domain-containing protein [Leptolyngbya boryana]WNZ44520.1 NACHT domain-containing protein [Leptolyngbya boryana CZ1]